MDKSLILFDGNCNLCNSLVRFVFNRDPEHKFYFANLRSGIARTFLKDIGLSANYNNSIVYIKDGIYHLKSTAGLTLLKDIGGLWKFSYIFIIVPKAIRDWGYDLIAKNRNKFSVRSQCEMHPAQLKRQILE